MSDDKKPVVEGPLDGNAFAVMGAVAKSLKPGEGVRRQHDHHQALA
jgi:hypothetical protein